MSDLSGLSAVLQQQVGVCRRMLLVLKITRKALSGTDPAPLEDCMRQQVVVAEELAGVDATRAQLTAETAVALALPADATLAALIGALRPAQQAALAPLARQLGELVSDIQRQQRVNQRLLEHALAFTDFNLELVASLGREQAAVPTYSPYGQGASYSDAGGVNAAVNYCA